jgi:hypothetical protein
VNWALFHFGLALLNLIILFAGESTVGGAAFGGAAFGFNLGVGLMHAVRPKEGK